MLVGEVMARIPVVHRSARGLGYRGRQDVYKRLHDSLLLSLVMCMYNSLYAFNAFPRVELE